MASLSRSLAAKGIPFVLLTAVLSGVSNFVNFKAVPGTNVDAFLTVRNVVVFLMLTPLFLLVGHGSRSKLRSSDWLRLAAIGLIGGAVPFLLYFRGFQMATSSGGAASASFGYRTLFLMAGVLGVVFLKERISMRLVVAAGLLLVGNAVLLTLSGPIWTDGTAFVLLATALWAGEYTLSKRVLRDLPSGTVALGRMGFGGLFLGGYLALTGQMTGIAAFTGADWQMVALSAILLVGFVATWYSGLKHVNLSVATSALVLSFPITWALDVVLKGKTFTVVQAAGVIVIVFGVGLAIGVASLRETWGYVASAWRARLRTGFSL